MREFLTIIACLLIALLTAALVGPRLVDWSAHRDVIEAQLSRALGAPVTIHGDVELKLLPTPILALDGVDINGDGGVSLRAGKVRLEMAVMPLMRGEMQFYDASIDHPDIHVTLGPDGALPAVNSAALPASTRFQRFDVTNGTLRLDTPASATPLVVEGVRIDAEIDSLAGPFRGSGSFRRGGATMTFHFATGAIENNRMSLKLVADAAAGLPRIDLDGALALADKAGARRLAFEGASVVSGPSPAPWRVSGPLILDAKSASIDPMETRVGGDEAALTFQGSAKLDFGAHAQARIALTSRQLDLDQWNHISGSGADTLLAAAQRWLAQPSAGGQPAISLDASLTSPAIIVGGDSLNDVSIEARMAPGSPADLKLTAGSGPGGSRLTLSGALEPGASATFHGQIDAGARDVRRLADWLAPFAPDAAKRLGASPFRAMDVAGDVAISATGADSQALTIKADRSTLAGKFAFTPATGGQRAKITANLTSQGFDLDGAPDLTQPAAALANTDLALDLDARAIRLARFGNGMIDAGHISARVRKTGDALRLENLSIANLGGASLTLRGDTTPAGARLDGRLSADRLGDLAALLRRVAPGPWSDALGARATALSPAQISFSLDATRPSPGETLRLAGLTLDGTARGTTISVTAKPEASAFAGSFSLDSKDSPLLLRQIGFDTTPLSGAGPGHVAGAAHGGDAGFDLAAKATIAGVDLGIQGKIANLSRADGQISIASADAAPLLRILALGLPNVTATLPIQANAKATIENGRVALADIDGAIAGSKVGGDLALAADPAAGGRRRLTGVLTIDGLSLPSLAQFAMGPPQTPRPGAFWSQSPFGPSLADAPLASVALRVHELRLANGLVGEDAKLGLELAPGLVGFNEASMRFHGGQLDGRLTLRRDGPTAALSGESHFSALKLDWPALSGSASGRLNLSSTGQNAGALVAGLAGEGAITIAHLAIPRADPDAPDRILAQSGDSGSLISENDLIALLRREVDKAPSQLGDKAFDASMAAGVLRLTEAGGPTINLDARAFTGETRLNLKARRPPKDWEGPPPNFTIVWKGPVAAPMHDVEAGDFVGALTARAVARETARVEALEADIRERASFARREKGFAFMRQRQREIAAYEVEQARLAAEAEKRRIEDERKRALEAAREERARQAAEARRQVDPPTPPPRTMAPPINIAPAADPPGYQAPPSGGDPSAAGRY